MQTDYLCHEEIRQRVTLVRALAIESELLLLDDLFTVLDGYNMDSVKHLIKDVVAERKISCIVVTHRVMDSHDAGDRICILQWDTNIEEGKPSDLSACGCHGVRTSS